MSSEMVMLHGARSPMMIAEFDEAQSPASSNLGGEQGSVLVARVGGGGGGETGTTTLNGHNEIQIQVRNVICNYSLPMHVDLRKVAMSTRNVVLDRSRGVLYKQKRDPHCYVKLYNSGKVYIVGCRSEEDCKRAARGVGRMVQRSTERLDKEIRIRDFRISNMLSTCKLPFGIKIEEMARKYPQAYYEPELTVGLVWKYDSPKASLRIHTTGTITITGTTSSSDTILAIEKIYPICAEFQCAERAPAYKPPKVPQQRRRPAPPIDRSYVTAPVVTKQPRKTAPIYDPACSEFFEENMMDEFQDFEDEERYYAENLC